MVSNAEMVYEDLVARGKKEETAKRWRARVRSFEDCCGVKDSYGRGDVVKWLAELRRRDFGQNSINTMLRAVKLLCDVQGWEDGWPRLSMPKVRTDEVRRPVLSKDDVRRLVMNARQVCSARDQAFLAASTVYGLRREEIGTLEVTDGVVKVHTVKGGNPTVQLIPEGVGAYLRDYKGTKDVRYLTRIFQKIVNKCGLGFADGYGWHSVRRALATELVLSDVSALNILRFMRWSDAGLKGEFGMLVIYAKRDQDKIDRAIFAAHPFLPFWSERPLTDGEGLSYSIHKETEDDNEE